MKKIIIGCMLAGSLAIAGSVGQVGLGYSKGGNSNNITAFGSLNVLSNIGLRLEYTKNISENPEFSTEDISRYGLFATYTLPLPANFSVTPKIGLTKTDGTFQLIDTLQTVSNSSTEFTYGLEVNYHFNEKISVFAGYTDYGNTLELTNIDSSKLDSAHYTFGVKIDL